LTLHVEQREGIFTSGKVLRPLLSTYWSTYWRNCL